MTCSPGFTNNPETAFQSAAHQAIIAGTQGERDSAFSVRYTVYIEEQAKRYSSADHASRRLMDKLDESATIILVFDRGGPCGTVRANWRSSPEARETYDHQFELTMFDLLDPGAISICSRLAVLRRCRGTRVAGLLFREIYTVGIQTGTIVSFAACAPFLRPLFSRFGFREYIEPWEDPIVGTLHRMVLVLDDLEYLSCVRSPFLGIARSLHVEHSTRNWLTELLDQYRGCQNRLQPL